MVNFKHIAQPMGEVLQMHKGIKNREMVGNHDYALNPDGSGAGENIFWLRPVFRLWGGGLFLQMRWMAKRKQLQGETQLLFSYKSPLRWNGSQLSHQDLANASPPIMARGWNIATTQSKHTTRTSDTSRETFQIFTLWQKYAHKEKIAYICISLHFSAFLCISLYFSAFLCISLHFSVFLCKTLHSSENLCISLHFTFYI